MGKESLNGLLISDFNIDNLARFLVNDQNLISINCKTAPFDQVIPSLLALCENKGVNHYDFVVVWTRPECVLPSFNDVLSCRKPDFDKLISEVDEFATLLTNLKDNVRSVFIPSWVVPSYNRGLGMLDMRHKMGMSNLLMHANLRLSECIDGFSNFYILNTSNWIAKIGSASFNPKMWYMGKIAFANEIFKEASVDLKSALSGVQGQAKKLIIVDLDDTLWGGIIGDDGWGNLVLGGHDPIGEAFADFQQKLKILTNRGIILGIVSKNNESVALEGIREHPEMILSIDDFAGWKINWKDKAQNVAELASELNLGLQSVVFIDDNPVERARVKNALPEVTVPEWPRDKTLYAKTLLEMNCFNQPTFSDEDFNRKAMYAAEKDRRILKKSVGSVDDFLKSLDIYVDVRKFTDPDKQRVLQLLNKTNQMNLSTRRMTEQDLLDWLSNEKRILVTFRIKDKFGDSGLTGIGSLELYEDKTARIIDFVVSCRVMGRKIENAMLYILISYCRDKNIKQIFCKYLPTAKNKPCKEFLENESGFFYNRNEDRYDWNLDNLFVLPDCINLQNQI